MTSLKVILAGIILILSSLFFLGICILNRGGRFDGVALFLFVIGIIVSIIGLFFIRSDTNEEDDDE